jgi:long-chain acyl-CoA synthetase
MDGKIGRANDGAPLLNELLAESYAANGERIAARDEHRGVTYAELGRRANRFARGLLALGVSPGDRIILLGPNRVEWMEADQGIALGGFVRVGLLPRLHPRELEVIAEDVEPTVVIVDPAWLAEAGRSWIPASVRHVVALGDDERADPSLTAFGAVLDAGDDDALPPVDGDAPLWIMYTSGSTGAPKGVIATRRTIGAMARGAVAEMPMLKADDAILHTAPISHFSGCMVLAGVAVGASNVLAGAFRAADVIAAVDGGEASVLPLVPTQINMVVDELVTRGRATGPLAGLRLVPYAGSAIAPTQAARAREALGDVLLQFYASSEAPLPLTVLRPEDHTMRLGSGGHPRLSSAGRPSRFAEVAIADDNGEPLARGEVGEIVVRGPTVSPGYWRRPEATAESFRADGWMRSGDVGYLDDDEFLYLVDRRKDMIVTGGFNVYPRETENVIVAMDGVRDVVVVGAPDPRWGEAIVAVVVLEDDAEVTAEEVIDHCRGAIGGYKVPKRVEFVDALPTLGSGKVDKRSIRERLWAGQERRI